MIEWTSSLRKSGREKRLKRETEQQTATTTSEGFRRRRRRRRQLCLPKERTNDVSNKDINPPKKEASSRTAGSRFRLFRESGRESSSSTTTISNDDDRRCFVSRSSAAALLVLFLAKKRTTLRTLTSFRKRILESPGDRRLFLLRKREVETARKGKQQQKQQRTTKHDAGFLWALWAANNQGRCPLDRKQIDVERREQSTKRMVASNRKTPRFPSRSPLERDLRKGERKAAPASDDDGLLWRRLY